MPQLKCNYLERDLFRKADIHPDHVEGKLFQIML
jgi:hypothetical protein